MVHKSEPFSVHWINGVKWVGTYSYFTLLSTFTESCHGPYLVRDTQYLIIVITKMKRKTLNDET